MTVAGELARRWQRMQFILSIEGVGWPDDEYSIQAGGWSGLVFATSDVRAAGDIADELGCDVLTQMEIPGALTQSFNPRTLEWRASGLTFILTDVAKTLDSIFQPHLSTLRAGVEYGGRLNGPVQWDTTTIDVAYTNPGGTVSPLAGGATAFLGGSEAVLLGTRSALGGDVYRYTGCTRSYLGTRRGNIDPRAPGNGDRFVWKTDTIVTPHNPRWQHRRVILWARVPGEEAETMVRLFTGRIVPVGGLYRIEYGTQWRVVTDPVRSPDILRQPRVPVWTVERIGFLERLFGEAISDTEVLHNPAAIALRRGSDHFNRQALATLFPYRNRVPGGTSTAFGLTVSNPNIPQGPSEAIGSLAAGGTDTGINVYPSGRLLLCGKKHITRAMYYPRLSDKQRMWELFVDSANAKKYGSEPSQIQKVEVGDEVRPLLDNIDDDLTTSWYAVNNTIRRNVIDVFLIHLTSQDGEFWRGDADAGGASAKVIEFTGEAPGWAEDAFAGYALHCVEGDNVGEARPIVANGEEDITVAYPFSNNFDGCEYQIRSTIYDVMPLGWGMCARPVEVDVRSWERCRNAHCVGANLGRYILGTDPKLDMWQLFVGVLAAYGVVPYRDPSTGKLAARFVGQSAATGIGETYTTVVNSELLNDAVAEVNMLPEPRVSTINLRVRGERVAAVVPVMAPENPLEPNGRQVIVAYTAAAYRTVATVGDEEHIETIRMPDADSVLDGKGEDHDIKAMLNGPNDLERLRTIALGRLYLYNPGPPQTGVPVDIKHALTLMAGGLMLVTASSFAAVNPYTGASGWSGQLCRIIEHTFDFSQLGTENRIQVLNGVNGAKIAPACIVTAKGTTPNRFVCDPWNFVQEGDGVSFDPSDMQGFAVNDRVELRSTTGAFKEGPFTIASFGTNAAATPEEADTARINVNESIAATIAAGDYLTFSPWSSSNTSNMNDFAFYADATDEELGSGDAPKRYL